MKCANGHDVDPTYSFCPVCDAPLLQTASVRRSPSSPGWASPSTVPVCPNGHPIPAGSTECPLCARLEESPTTKSQGRLVPFVIVEGLMVVAGIVVTVSASMSWMVASGKVPHSWNAFQLGDGVMLNQGVEAGSSPIGTLVVLLGVS